MLCPTGCQKYDGIKVAVITGCGSGVGEAAAKMFTEQGARVFAVDVNGQSLRAARVNAARAGCLMNSARLSILQREILSLISLAACGDESTKSAF